MHHEKMRTRTRITIFTEKLAFFRQISVLIKEISNKEVISRENELDRVYYYFNTHHTVQCEKMKHLVSPKHISSNNLPI